MVRAHGARRELSIAPDVAAVSHRYSGFRMSTSITWKTVVTSSSILSLALMGDVLLYAVLPVHAQSFGVNLVWVGVLLSANRFVRVFAYGWIARLGQRFGLRRLCIVALLAAIVSTALYGLATGAAALLLARILWGLAFAGLLLVTLGYAVHDRTRVSSRLGWGRGIQHVGPIIALVAGAWLTGILGPRTVFVWLALLTAAAIPLALSLPVDRTGGEAPISTRSLGRPTLMDLLFALQGFGVDGVFAVSITLLLAQELPLDLAVMSGASLLAVRHVCDAVGAPLFGAIGERHGAGRILVVSMAFTAVGFIGIASGFTIAGTLLMLFFRSALVILGPAVVVSRMSATQPVIGDLARMHAWRDVGAAVGPLATGMLLTVVAAELLHGIVGVLVAVGMLAWARDQRRRTRGA